tara:strand:+ start:430 stop:564 length:135 start_codon:yes stop_codon:yes gene_type:complete
MKKIERIKVLLSGYNFILKRNSNEIIKSVGTKINDEIPKKIYIK